MHHYFIGKLLNEDDSKNLSGAQSYIVKKTGSKKITNLNAKFAYLGYMDEETFLQLQDKISNILGSISDNFAPHTCKYTGFDITGEKTTKKSISVLYENDVITKILVPYLRSYLSPITGESNVFFPHVSLARIDVQNINDEIRDIVSKVFIPKYNPTFKIDTIDIMKGIPKVVRSGPSSKLDEMDMVLVSSYKLVGSA